jgi:hypothetical protein
LGGFFDRGFLYLVIIALIWADVGGGGGGVGAYRRTACQCP